jgi:hypothetical protein
MRWAHPSRFSIAYADPLGLSWSMQAHPVAHFGPIRHDFQYQMQIRWAYPGTCRPIRSHILGPSVVLFPGMPTSWLTHKHSYMPAEPIRHNFRTSAGPILTLKHAGPPGHTIWARSSLWISHLSPPASMGNFCTVGPPAPTLPMGPPWMARLTGQNLNLWLSD